eukprot:5806419-Ditylum_brightwellii.AAC.1
MEGIINCPQVDSAWHKEINYVRLFLRALTLADISTSDGRKINHTLLTSATKRLHNTFSGLNRHVPKLLAGRSGKKQYNGHSA